MSIKQAIEALEAADAVCQRIIEQDGGILGGVDFHAHRKGTRAALAALRSMPEPVDDFVQCQECKLLDPDATCPQCPGWLKTLDEQQIEDCFQEAAGADEETHIRFANSVINKFCEMNRLPMLATPHTAPVPLSDAEERTAFEADAEPMGFDLTRRCNSPEPSSVPFWGAGESNHERP